MGQVKPSACCTQRVQGLTRETILRALTALAERLPAGTTHSLVDIEDARLLLSKLVGTRDETWRQIEPRLVPGRELKAQDAFGDLWEAAHGSA